MIRKRVYLGIPMGPRRNRRILVVCYWIAVVMILAGGAAVYLRDPEIYGSTWMTIVVLLVYSLVPLLLGGDEGIGPIGDFAGDPPPPRWTLLWAVDRLRSRRKRAPGDRLFDRCFDERDQRVRDRAHYLAYQILRPIPIAAACLFLTAPATLEAHSLIRRYGLLLVLLVILFSIVFWTLPQSIILWTEPDMEEVQTAN